MKNQLDKEIKYLEDEILRLKTSEQKSAQNAELVRKTITVNAPLTLIVEPPLDPKAQKYKLYEVVQDSDEITTIYLSWYYSDLQIPSVFNEEKRSVLPTECILENGNLGIKLLFSGSYGVPNSDVERMMNGESITLTVDLTVVSTGDFSIMERI